MNLELATRLGFVALVVLLTAFALLFVHERAETDASIERQRHAREEKVTAAFLWKLDRQLDVAEARLEALETLPNGDVDGLLLIRDGVRLLPREPADFTLSNGWHTVQRGNEVHGVHVNVMELIDAEPDEVWRFPISLESPRFDEAHAAARRTLVLKSVLLGVTALLGVVVVLLARLTQRRKEEALAAQREFVATVSHELRTPLATLRLLGETLERKLPTDGPAKDYPRRIVAASDGLSFFIENILSFNRLESGKWVPRREPVSFTKLEQMIRDDVASLVDVNVELHFSGLEFTKEVDPELIKILALNLIRNAIKYGQRDPVKISVVGNDQRITFTDNGPGIPASEHERVFDAFHRLERKGGSGLGLALVKKIAQLHGGDVRIARSSSDGTTFEVTL